MLPVDYPREPAHLWHHFARFCQIPRASGQEQAIKRYIQQLAQEQGASWEEDGRGNLLVRVAASAGREAEAIWAIQNHLDMVTVKRRGCAHDFQKDPLQLVVEQGWLRATDTTLGADNGIGCAAALALMTDPTLSHPALELLFTVEEETGLFGASGLRPGWLRAERMLNLDTEDWGELFIGCAGARACAYEGVLQRQPIPAGAQAMVLLVEGLAGGHSGLQIHEGRGNALKLLVQCLRESPAPVVLAGLEGGVAHNVIPREARALLWIETAQRSRWQGHLQQLQASWRAQLPAVDQGLCVRLEPCTEVMARPLIPACQQALLSWLEQAPHGVLQWQDAQTVALSANCARVQTHADALRVDISLRSLAPPIAEPAWQPVDQWAAEQGWTRQVLTDYPGWSPDRQSPLLQQVIHTFTALFASAPVVRTIHAGLECGIVRSHYPAMDVISFGPTIRDAHSPSERVEIATVAPFWQLLCALIGPRP